MELSEDNFKYMFKLCVVGNVFVGKTALSTRFARNEFSNNYKSTIGVDLFTCNVVMGSDVVKVQIWDTAGQERFRCVAAPFYRHAVGVAIVYDVTSRQSFQGLDKWIQDIREHCCPNVKLLLIGNKSDVTQNRLIAYSEGEQYARDNGMTFFETSAQNASNVNEAFMDLTRSAYEEIVNSNNNELTINGTSDCSRQFNLTMGNGTVAKNNCCK